MWEGWKKQRKMETNNAEMEKRIYSSEDLIEKKLECINELVIQEITTEKQIRKRIPKY